MARFSGIASLSCLSVGLMMVAMNGKVEAGGKSTKHRGEVSRDSSGAYYTQAVTGTLREENEGQGCGIPCIPWPTSKPDPRSRFGREFSTASSYHPRAVPATAEAAENEEADSSESSGTITPGRKLKKRITIGGLSFTMSHDDSAGNTAGVATSDDDASSPGGRSTHTSGIHSLRETEDGSSPDGRRPPEENVQNYQYPPGFTPGYPPGYPPRYPGYWDGQE